MKVEGQHTYDASRAVVWRALMDPVVLARTLPGCEELVADGNDRFKGTLTVKIGPVQGTFAGTVHMTDIVEREAFHVHVHGQGAPGFLDGRGRVRLEDRAEGTALHYGLDVHVGGRVASVGQRLLDSSARSITRQALDGLGRQLAAGAGMVSDVSRPAGGGSGPPHHLPFAPGPAAAGRAAPRSQARVAATVARDVVSDLVASRRRTWMAAGAVGLVAVVVWLVWMFWRLASP